MDNNRTYTITRLNGNGNKISYQNDIISLFPNSVVSPFHVLPNCILFKDKEFLEKVPSPSYIMDENLLEENAKILNLVKERTGCKILVAIKGFSAFSTFPIFSKYLDGTATSSLNEARLGSEEFGKEVHVYSPAYSDKEFDDILNYISSISFNSFSQWLKFKDRVKHYPKNIACGLRLNPEHSEVETEMYDPCAVHSRLGVTLKEFRPELLDGIEGFHIHTLCEKNADSLARTLAVIEQKFGRYFHQVKWLNLGGGHHITRPDYNIDLLCNLIDCFQQKYNLKVILEPGEAVALNTGFLVTSVLDIIKNEMDIAILDTSAAAHMPDVLEMPYLPEIYGATKANVFPHTYRIGGNTCLSGDIIGDYSFKKPLEIGQKLIFLDQAHYTMVKNTTFNGIPLPSIAIITKENELKRVKEFGYGDFKGRLS